MDVEEIKKVIHFVDLVVLMITDFDGIEVDHGYKLQFLTLHRFCWLSFIHFFRKRISSKIVKADFA